MDFKKTNNSSLYLNLEPSYGASVNFSSISDDFVMGDNNMSKMAKGINALNMSASLKFTELTDDETAYAIEFLQNKYYYNIQNYDTAGHFDNKKVKSFFFQGGIFEPYKTNLKYFCTNFTHNKSYYNSNEINASFQCAYPSILNNVEPVIGYDPRIFHGILSNPALSSSDDNQAVAVNFDIPNEYASYNNSASILKNQPVFQTGSYRTMYPNNDRTVSDGNTYSVNSLARFGFNGKSIVNRSSSRSSIFLENNEDVYEYPYAPIIKQQNGNGITEINYRMFDHYPSYAFQIKHSPKYKQSNVIEIYKRFSLYGFNSNLANLSLEFNERTDEDAKRILLFLESHLGHKKFGFHIPQDYSNNLSSSDFTSPHRKTFSTFVCPEWSHTISYKNNNSISATFIECPPY